MLPPKLRLKQSLYVAGAGRYKALHNEEVHGGTVY